MEGYLATILDGVVSDEQTLQHVVTRSIARIQGMRQLILDLLDVTRLEAGMKARELRDGATSARSRASASRRCAPQAEAKSVTMELVGVARCRWSAVRAEIDMVLNNLLTNAIKYNREGGTGRSCRWAATRTRSRSRSATRGSGSTQRMRPSSFSDFVRIKNAKTRGIEGSRAWALATVKTVSRGSTTGTLACSLGLTRAAPSP